jgi:TRAP-type C4-dicarboxylate transport system permease small subunit
VLPPRTLGVWVRFVHAVCAALMFFLTWQIWIKAGKISGYGDTTDVLRIVLGPFVYFMAVMTALTGVVHIFKVYAPGAAKAQQGTT